MELQCVEDYALDLDSGELHCSPEELLLDLEERLENGELSLTDVINYLNDLGVTK